MNNLFELVKVDFMSSFGIGKKGNKKKDKNTSFKVILTLVIIFGLVLSIIYNLSFTFIFKEANVSMTYPVMMFLGLATILTLTTSVFKTKSIFLGRDYDMLMSMPISKKTIISSKIATLYLVELLYSAIILLPTSVITFIFSGLKVIYLVSCLLGIFLAPAIAMMLAALFALFITLVADRYKFGNAINVLLYLILFAAIMTFQFLMNTGTSTGEEGELIVDNYLVIANTFGWINPTSQFIKFALEYNNPLFLLLYVGVNILIAFIVISFISLFFEKVHDIVNQSNSKEVYVKKNLATIKQGKALLKHEFKRFFNTKFYFINSISGGICAIMMAGFTAYMFSPFGPNVNGDELMLFLTKNYGYVGFIIIAFGIGIATPASVSISIEGNKMWMIKAYPIDYKEFLKNKFYLSTIVLGVCSIIASILMCILLQSNLYCYIISCVLSLSYTALASIVGLRINLRKYKFDWKNEQECCKNSTAVVLSMLLDWGIMLLSLGSLVGLSFINNYLAGISVSVIYILLSYILYKNLMKNAEKKMNAIEF